MMVDLDKIIGLFYYLNDNDYQYRLWDRRKGGFMKKGIAALVASMTFALAPAAYAAEPVKFSGDVSVKYEKDTANGLADTSGSVYTLKLMGEMDLGSNWSLYARLGAQRVSQPEMSDFYPSGAYAADKKSVAAIDQFGLVYKGENFTYKLGRQDVAVGITALLYSRPDSNIGQKAFVDGVSATGKSGVTDITALIAREDNTAGKENNKVYAVRAGYSPTESFNYGLTLGRYQGSIEGEDVTANHWAVDGTYKIGKSSLTGEYNKSSRSLDNKAYAMTLNYDFDGKTAAYVTGFRVEANGSMGAQSDFDSGNRGTHYGISHKLSDKLGMDVVYKDQKFISTGSKNTTFEATLTYSF